VTSSGVDSLRLFLERGEVRNARRRDAILVRLDQAVPRLIKRFPTISRVAVIGSLLTPTLFREDSDVDLVVCGLLQKDYFDAFLLLEHALQAPVDLLREEEIPERLRLRLKDALILYADQRIRNSADSEERTACTP